MGANSKIEWTDHTFNPWRGCDHKVDAGVEHPGCAHCYAEAMARRNPKTLGEWGEQGTRVVASEGMWRAPLKWNKQAEKDGVRRSVFCESMADVFEDWRGQLKVSSGQWAAVRREWGQERDYAGCQLAGGSDAVTLNMARGRLFRLIDDTPNLDWLLLTKRPENVRAMTPDYNYHACVTGDCPHDYQSDCDKNTQYRDNVWIGTSISDQRTADLYIPRLLELRDLTPVLFLSIEPLLGPVELPREFLARGKSSWVIVGGESGPHARPMHPEWVRSIRDQCQAAGVPFFFKQWGEWMPVFHGIDPNVGDPNCRISDVKHFEDGNSVWKVGKAAAGRTLDGRTWDEFPEVAHA